MNSNRRFNFALLAALACARLVTAGEPAVLGYIEPYKTISVSTAETGVIAGMLVEEGTVVKKGQVLARLDTATLQAELEIARAEAQLQTTRKKRLDDLSGTARATPEELDRARTDATIKDAQVRKIEAMIENRTMRTPVAGIVTEIKRDPSESVSPSAPHVLTVVQIDKLTVNLFLPPARALGLKTGAPVELQILDGGGKIPASVEFISPVTDGASGTVRVKLIIDNAAGTYRSGARCTLGE